MTQNFVEGDKYVVTGGGDDMMTWGRKGEIFTAETNSRNECHWNLLWSPEWVQPALSIIRRYIDD